jgi:hypothetical protein
MAWYNSAWSNRKKITIDNTKVSGTSHSSFPVLVSITDADIKAKAQADGDDILFTATDGTTKLDHEIEDWDSGTGVLVAWVRVPTLSGTVDTDIYVYYGNPAASDQQSVAATWGANFEAVWHLNDDLLDSSGNGNTLANNGSDDVAAQIADGQECIDTNQDYLSDTDFAGISSNIFTWSWWMKDNSGSAAFRRWMTTTNGALGANDVIVRESSTSGQINVLADSLSASAAATWKGSQHIFHLVSDGTDTKLYVDGVLKVTVATANVTPSNGIYIGGYFVTTASEYSDGIFDEVRIAAATRSTDWMLTEKNNQGTPGTFYSVGAEEDVPESVLDRTASGILLRTTSAVLERTPLA